MVLLKLSPLNSPPNRVPHKRMHKWASQKLRSPQMSNLKPKFIIVKYLPDSLEDRLIIHSLLVLPFYGM